MFTAQLVRADWINTEDPCQQETCPSDARLSILWQSPGGFRFYVLLCADCYRDMTS